MQVLGASFVYKNTKEDLGVKKIGYIRISTKDQNPDRQYLAMEKYGICKKNIYMDMLSGKDFSRPEYTKMLATLEAGDLLVIKSIDRLGRNYEEILIQWKKITKEIQADIEVIDMPLLNTRNGENDLTGTFIADLVLQILAYVAETERNFIRQRQAEGIAAAKAKGIHFGGRKAKLPENFDKYYEKWSQGKISARKAAKCLDMSHSTFYRRCKELQNANQ